MVNGERTVYLLPNVVGSIQPGFSKVESFSNHIMYVCMYAVVLQAAVNPLL